MEDWLKQRLVGAVVLVALGVIFIPMIIESPRQESQSAGRLNEPVEPETDYLERSPQLTEIEIPLPDDTRVVGIGPGETPEPTAPAAEVGDPQPAPEAEVAAEPEPAPAPVPAAAVASPASSGPLTAWVVQVGSFQQQSNAMALRDKLRKGGFTSYVERVKSGTGSVYRVRVGPESSYDRVTKLKQGLLDRYRLKGVIMKHH